MYYFLIVFERDLPVKMQLYSAQIYIGKVYAYHVLSSASVEMNTRQMCVNNGHYKKGKYLIRMNFSIEGQVTYQM